MKTWLRWIVGSAFAVLLAACDSKSSGGDAANAAAATPEGLCSHMVKMMELGDEITDEEKPSFTKDCLEVHKEAAKAAPKEFAAYAKCIMDAADADALEPCDKLSDTMLTAVEKAGNAPPKKTKPAKKKPATKPATKK
jgi:hypothetical protein